MPAPKVVPVGRARPDRKKKGYNLMAKGKQEFRGMESTFIQMFDDVYRSREFAKYVRNDKKPINKEDIKLRFLPAFLLQQTIIIPAALFIDHKELISFLHENEDWCMYLFDNKLIKIAHFEGDKDWDAFHKCIGGFTGKRPLGRTLNFEASERVQKKYEKLKSKKNGNIEMYEYYKTEFPDEAALEILKTYALIGGGNTVSFKYEEKYEDIIERIFPPSVLEAKKITSRDIAFHELKKLKWAQPQYLDQWHKLAIYAKHEQFVKSLKLLSFEFSLTGPEFHKISLALPSPSPEEDLEVGGLRHLVSKSVGADLLARISKTKGFGGLRDGIRISLRNNDPVSATVAIRSLCNLVADKMGKAHTGGAIRLFKPIKYLGVLATVIGSGLAMKGFNPLGYYVFAGGASIEFGSDLANKGYERFVSVRCKNQLEMMMRRILGVH